MPIFTNSEYDDFNFWIDTPSNRKKLIERGDKAAKIFRIEQDSKKQKKNLKGKKPDYGYKKNYA